MISLLNRPGQNLSVVPKKEYWGRSIFMNKKGDFETTHLIFYFVQVVFPNVE